ncbi:MAG: type II toxin-antitoxin system HicB family antitoxin [Candidatus Binataceae bacterium]
MKYAVIIERAKDGSYSAHVPDLPVCTASACTVEEVLALIREGVEIYIDELKSEGNPVPEPVTSASEVEVNV